MKKKEVVHKPLNVLKRHIIREVCGKASTKIDLNKVRHDWSATLERKDVKL